MLSNDFLLQWTQEWYSNNCDGDWEHNQNIIITTIDNPGWSITIDLFGTVLSDKTFHEVFIEESSNNWFCCRVVEGKFLGDCGPQNLLNVIQIFRNWAESP